MNNLVRAIASLALVLATCFPSAAFALDTGDIVVESVRGDVRVTMKGVPATVHAGTALELPATIDTGSDGAIDLRQGATTVSVGPQTRLEFPALEKPGAPVDRIVQPRGNAFYNIGKRAGRRLRVETPYLVGVIKGTQFNVAAQDEATTISLFEGLLEVRASDDSSVIDLKAGEIASRKRGDKSISVIKMDGGKSPPTQRGPAGPADSNGGASTPGSSRPAPAPGADELLVDAGVAAGSVAPSAPSQPSESIDAKASVGVDLGVRATDPAASAAASVSVSAANTNVDVAANVVAANAIDAGANVSIGSDSIDAGVAAGVTLGDAVNAGVDAGVNVSGGALGASADAGLAVGPAAVDVGAAANVDPGAGAVGVAANTAVDAGPLSAGVSANTAIDVAPANVAANVDLGTGVDVASVPVVDAGASAAVDLGAGAATNVVVNADVAGVGATVTAAANVGTGNVDLGVTVPGVIDLHVDLGLDDDSGSDATTPGTTPTAPGNETTTPPVIDVGGLLNGLLRRPGKK